MPTPLATLDDFYRLGLPAAACVPQPRPIEAVNATTNRILARGHGMITGTRLKLTGHGTLPPPTTKDELYEAVVDADPDLFALRYAEGPSAGMAVDFTSAGALPLMYLADPRPIIEAEIAAASSLVRDHLTGHSDVEAAPETVVKTTCTVAAYNFVFVRALAGPSFNDVLKEQLRLRYEDARRELARWLAGRPVAGLVDATPTKAESGARAKLIGVPDTANPDPWTNWGCGL